MGFSLSWIGFHGLGREEVLARTGLAATGRPDPWCEEPFSLMVQGGWTILVSRDFEHVSEQRLQALSAGTRLVACAVEEHVMVSIALGYEDGREIWSVAHDSQAGIYDLTISGTPPEALAEIQERLVGAQDAEGGEAANVDYVFDIPVELAAHLTGHRHDQGPEDGSDLPFEGLADPSAAKPAKRRWWPWG